MAVADTEGLHPIITIAWKNKIIDAPNLRHLKVMEKTNSRTLNSGDTFILHCSAVSSAEKNGIAEKKRFNRKPTKSLDVVVEGS